MNEDATTAAADTSADNINSQEGSVSADEVAQVMGLPKPTAAEPETSEVEEPETPETPESPETPVEGEQPETPEATPKTPPVSTEAPTFSLQVEDANGEVLTLNVGDDIEKVLENFEPKSNGQILKVLHDFMRLEDQKAAHDAQQETAAQEAQRAEAVSKISQGWDAEIQKLQGEKRLPLDAKIAERRNAVFKYMSDENQKREADGRPLIQSFEDALDKLELQERKDADKEAAKKAKEDVRQRGNMVGGSSAPATSGTPPYVAGSARNMDQALRATGLLK